MSGYVLTAEKITEFGEFLRKEECQRTTVEKYLRNVRFFAAWLDGRAVDKELVTQWKACLQERQFAPAP